MNRFSVGLFNDSFPPVIDGVAQTVKNYATYLSQKDCDVTVVTPSYHDAVDDYPFDVLRYASLPMPARVGYRAGFPFGPETLYRVRNKKFDIMHVHAPFMSSMLVSAVNRHPKVPTVLTYHTRFDLDFQSRIPTEAMRKLALDFVVKNVRAVDEVWVVTATSGEALRNIGYEGEYRVMENGTDFARGRATQAQIAALRETYRLYEDVPVFLFVGRMMWYKNVRLILDTFALLKQQGIPFRALMVGDGYDAPKIKDYAHDCQLHDCVTFTGAVSDREQLRVFYSLADVFVFPSTYDTAGIVVKEAAACDCPSLLVQGSCAAEGVTHGKNGFLAKETPASCAAALATACANRTATASIGQAANKTLYLSWEDAVGHAYTRYREILESR